MSKWMGRKATVVSRNAILIALLATNMLPARGLRPDWRSIGNTVLDLNLPAPASGGVERVWFGENGVRLYVRTAAGRQFVTEDLKRWTQSSQPLPPTPEPPTVIRLPEPGAQVRQIRYARARLYAFGRHVWRSDDEGATWRNLTAYHGVSLLGGPIRDLAISPFNAPEIVVAGDYGLWRSSDGGESWGGINTGLPNLPVHRILRLPKGVDGMVIELAESDTTAALTPFEWAPGEKIAWRPTVASDTLAREHAQKSAYSALLGARITAVASAREFVYAGAADGRLWSSSDQGRTWFPRRERSEGPVEQIWIDPSDARIALAAFGPPTMARSTAQSTARIVKTFNAGVFWDDITANLPGAAVYSITADRASGAIYAGTGDGVFMTRTDLGALGPATQWTEVSGKLPDALVRDVRLDASGNQIYVAIEGYGLFAAPAPHRAFEPRLVNAADLTVRAAAPGGLISMIGAQIQSARAGGLAVPVLDASGGATQMQIPFEVTGASITLAMQGTGGRYTLGLPLQKISPAIFVDPDGTPFLLDGENGLALSATTPARSGAALQILAAGLGKVEPEWPTGLPAPLENSPAVAVPVQAFLDGSPVEVTRAILAPGYVGMYLVEIRVPAIVNSGPAELYLEAEGQQSNRVRVYLEP